MNYTEAIEYISSVRQRGSRPGLSRIRELAELLGNPQRNTRFIHVGGTNGKGSTGSYLTSVLTFAGYKVGTFSSPCVRSFNEQIMIEGKPVSNYRITKAIEKVKAAAEKMADPPTEFELICGVAFEIFSSAKCDVAVLEVGMGGRLDSTNIIEKPLLSVITGISLDHTNFLGASLDKIASEKAGIIKEGCPTVTAFLQKEAAEVIGRAAAEKASPVTTVDKSKIKVSSNTLDGITMDYGEFKSLSTTLIGSYQPLNIALVCEIVKVLEKGGMKIGKDALYNGIAEAKWPARFELLSREPLVVFDGGHNEEGVFSAIETAKTVFGGKKPVLLTGVMGDKAYHSMVSLIAENVSEVFTLKVDNPRALDAEALAEVYRSAGAVAHPSRDIATALKAARKKAKEENLPLLILGSLYLYKDIYKHFK